MGRKKYDPLISGIARTGYGDPLTPKTRQNKPVGSLDMLDTFGTLKQSCPTLWNFNQKSIKEFDWSYLKHLETRIPPQKINMELENNVFFWFGWFLSTCLSYSSRKWNLNLNHHWWSYSTNHDAIICHWGRDIKTLHLRRRTSKVQSKVQ